MLAERASRRSGARRVVTVQLQYSITLGAGASSRGNARDAALQYSYSTVTVRLQSGYSIAHHRGVVRRRHHRGRHPDHARHA
eukprot:254014-Prorocentrum_minimum.AAC.1